MRLLLAAVLASGLAGPARAEPRLSPAAEAQLDEGLRRLYGLDYAGARAAFRRLIELEPESPFGYLFEAGGLWWQAAQEDGLFQSAPALQRLFEEDVASALRRAEAAAVSPDPRARADGHFASGMALGTRGQWNLLHRRYLAAYFDGRKAVKHLKKCLQLDPGYADAELGLGVYDYETARLSGVARLGFLVGMRGNEQRGLERLRFAMTRSRYSRRQAAEFLAVIYLVDRRDFARALPVVQTLRQDFPDSPYFLFLETLARRKLGDRTGSAALGRELLARAAADPAGFGPKWLTLACGLSDPECLAFGDVADALAWLDDALAQAPPWPEHAQTLLRLLRGHALDVLGRREEAEEEYRRVLAPPASGEALERARACLASPCHRDVLLRWLRQRAGLDAQDSKT